MRLFTFSGIAGSFTETNEGFGMIEFGAAVANAFPAGAQPNYDGRADIGHFRSFVNYGGLLGDAERAVTLDGSPFLNEEARALAPKYGAQILLATDPDPAETVLILAHSQGTNNCIHTLIWIFNNRPDFFAQRKLRCAFFDPKIGANLLITIFSLQLFREIDFVFFQSEQDILGNQALLAKKFIDEFPHGNHLWVAKLGHSSIHEWATLNKKQRILTLLKYQAFRRAFAKRRIELQRKRDKPTLTTQDLGSLQRFVRQYKMLAAKPAEALTGFLQGELSAKFRS
jgi:hypothetical protein